MSWNIKTPGDYINGPLTVAGSATITGDLTVDTNVLKVDTLNNRVGVNTATPSYPLHVLTNAVSGRFNLSNIDRTTANWARITNPQYATDASAGLILRPFPDSDLRQGAGIIASGGINNGDTNVALFVSSGVASSTSFAAYATTIAGAAVSHDWYQSAGSTAMTLNATGLGVGGNPTAKISCAGYSSANQLPDINIVRSSSGTAIQTGPNIVFTDGTSNNTVTLQNSQGRFGIWNYGAGAWNERLSVDANGNCGIGVTPSAGGSGYYKTLEIGKAGCGLFTAAASLTASELTYLSGNGVLAYNSGPEWKYGNNGAAAIYGIEDGVHKWYNATTGTAGVVFTPTQAMTLDASGNLLVKKTASGGTTLGVELLATGQINGATANQDNLNIYNTTAAAYRFYVNSAGTVFATNTTISAISDARFKENVQDIDVGLGAILALKPRKFDWKDGKGKNIKGDRGFIAQEFETVFPNLIDEWKENAPEGEAPYKSVRQDLIPVLVKAIQELTARVVTLENA